jgi:hypothetical protein
MGDSVISADIIEGASFAVWGIAPGDSFKAVGE